MFNTFKNFFRNKEKENYVWCILPENYHLHIINKTEKNWLMKKKDVKNIKNFKFSGAVKTTVTPFIFKVNYIFENNDYRKEYGCASKFTLIEFESKDKDFDDEYAIFQVYKNNVPVQYSQIKLKDQISKILLFTDFETTMTKDLNLLEKKIIILESSYKNQKMIPYIIQDFENEINSYIKNNFHIESFQKLLFKFLERVFTSYLYVNLENDNYVLFFSFLNCFKSTIIKHLKADPSFKKKFYIFRNKLQKFIVFKCKQSFEAFYNFEMETIGFDVLSNDLCDILKQFFYYADSNKMENILNILKKIDYKNIKINSNDTDVILFYYFSVQKKIEAQNEDQFNSFYKFTKEINKFKGKLY